VVPKGKARIRTQMSAAHTEAQIDRAAAAFGKVGRALGAVPEGGKPGGNRGQTPSGRKPGSDPTGPTAGKPGSDPLGPGPTP